MSIVLKFLYRAFLIVIIINFGMFSLAGFFKYIFDDTGKKRDKCASIGFLVLCIVYIVIYNIFLR